MLESETGVIAKEMEAVESKMASQALLSWMCYIISMGLAYFKYGFPLCGILILFGLAATSYQRWYETRLYYEHLKRGKLLSDESTQ